MTRNTALNESSPLPLYVVDPDHPPSVEVVRCLGTKDNTIMACILRFIPGVLSSSSRAGVGVVFPAAYVLR